MKQSALVQVDHLRKSFAVQGAFGRKTRLRAVDDVSFGILRGETFGLVGESGCGKSTLGRTILRLLEPDGGTIRYDGADITRVNMRPYRRRMQIVFQNPAGCLDPRTRIADIVAEGLRANKIGSNRTERFAIVCDLLEKVGLDAGTADRFPHEFSGGMQQRVGIARALAVNPEFIVCDEPISALDVSYQSQIINLLVEMQDSLGLTYLFISHDLTVVRHIANRVGVMYCGRLVELGGSEDVVGNAAHPYTRSLLAAIPVPDPEESRRRNRLISDELPADGGPPETGCRYRHLCERALPVCAAAAPELEEVSPGHFCACHHLA